MPGESRKKRAGLTLVELMVVLAVMGILVSAALPSMGLAFADRRVAMAARDVVSLFQRARYMSMAYGRAHRVVYMNDGGPDCYRTVSPLPSRRSVAPPALARLSTFENVAGS